jgi:hypothetical protein
MHLVIMGILQIAFLLFIILTDRFTFDSFFPIYMIFSPVLLLGLLVDTKSRVYVYWAAFILTTAALWMSTSLKN